MIVAPKAPEMCVYGVWPSLARKTPLGITIARAAPGREENCFAGGGDGTEAQLCG